LDRANNPKPFQQGAPQGFPHRWRSLILWVAVMRADAGVSSVAESYGFTIPIAFFTI
jgi:hypothetical protein